MKLKTTLLVSLLFLSASLVRADKPETKPDITFAETSYDFGVIPENGGPVSHDFVFTNSGDGQLVIISASASCGCTRPDYPKQPVKAGKRDKIKVTYNPKGRPGEFSKNVTVRTNVKGKRKVTLKIKGNVTPAKRP